MTAAGGVVTLGILLAVLAAVAAASQSLSIRYGTVTSDTADALLVVMGVNVVVLLPAAFLLGDPIADLNLTSFVSFTAAGLVGTLIGRAVYFEGIKRIGSSRAEPIKASQPLHATLIAVLVLGEVVTPGHMLAMLAIVAGVAMITYEHGRSSNGGGDASYVGVAFPVVAAVFFGLEPTLAKLGFAEGAAVLTGLTVKTVTAGVGFMAYVWWKRGIPRAGDFDRGELPWHVAAGVANTTFMLAYYGALELERVSVVVPLVQSSPLLVIVLSMLFVSDDLERVTPRLIAGALVAVAGAVGVTLLS